ncbi:hypothetical protein GCM10010254_16290 [Streptomyces chromofuscus]|nr:hypothetical protein GCM10010254_16290 [Streptomyces chromofuscus]
MVDDQVGVQALRAGAGGCRVVDVGHGVGVLAVGVRGGCSQAKCAAGPPAAMAAAAAEGAFMRA